MIISLKIEEKAVVLSRKSQKYKRAPGHDPGCHLEIVVAVFNNNNYHNDDDDHDDDDNNDKKKNDDDDDNK